MINRPFKRQAKGITFFTILCTVLCGCVQAPVFKTGEYALIKSSYPIVVINGIAIEDTYKLDLEAGENSLVVVYSSYQYDYSCTFRWPATTGTAYEVIDQENQYPLTLYRWHRKNGLWAVRLDPVDPQECIRMQKQ